MKYMKNRTEQKWNFTIDPLRFSDKRASALKIFKLLKCDWLRFQEHFWWDHLEGAFMKIDDS